MANCRALFSWYAHGAITGPQNQSKKPYNKNIINLEHLVSQTLALPY